MLAGVWLAGVWMAGPLVLGCGSRESMMRNLSSAYTQCRPAEITISDARRTMVSSAWVATCHGQRFDCRVVATGSHQTDVSCSPRVSGYARQATRGGEAARVDTAGRVERIEGAEGRARLHARVPLDAFTLVVLWDAGDTEVAFGMLMRGARASAGV